MGEFIAGLVGVIVGGLLVLAWMAWQDRALITSEFKHRLEHVPPAHIDGPLKDLSTSYAAGPVSMAPWASTSSNASYSYAPEDWPPRDAAPEDGSEDAPEDWPEFKRDPKDWQAELAEGLAHADAAAVSGDKGGQASRPATEVVNTSSCTQPAFMQTA